MTHPTRCAVFPCRARPEKRSPHRSGCTRTGRNNPGVLRAGSSSMVLDAYRVWVSLLPCPSFPKLTPHA
jgi:hypothetical protein